MILRLEREMPQGPRMFGQLTIEDLLQCYTLEDGKILATRSPGISPTVALAAVVGQPWMIAAKIPGQTAIPAGRYSVIWSFSQRFQRMLLEVLAVPQFTGIRIHAGNTEADTEGCVLVGKWRSATELRSSRIALRELERIVVPATRKEKVWLEVVNP